MRFTVDGGKEIAKLDGPVWYGSDEDSVALLRVDGEHGKGDRLVVVDRKTSVVVTDKILEGAHSWGLKRSVAETVTVRSKDSTVYFQSFEKQGTNKYHFGYSEANWRTGEAHPVPALPSGDDSHGAKRFASADAISKVFVREIGGKPSLIWGENKELMPAAMAAHTITEIVMVDAATGKEFLRKPLGGNFSSQIQPDRTGGRVYFMDPANGEIFYLDRETQTINSFAKTGQRNIDDWSSALVAAN